MNRSVVSISLASLLTLVGVCSAFSLDLGAPTLGQLALSGVTPAEPASLLLLGSGLMAVTAWRRRQ